MILNEQQQLRKIRKGEIASFEKLFHMNAYGKAFPRREGVVDELTETGMFQTPAPAPWREEELEYLKNALGIKGNGLV